MTGRKKCEILREIRKQIAKDNGITYLSSDCGNKSQSCRGTCAICDAEARYLNYEINEKARRGEKINISCVSLGNYLDNYEITEKELPKMDIGGMDEEMRERTKRALIRAGIKTIDDFSTSSDDEMNRVRELGKNSLKDVKERLRELNLSFKHYE